jgi:DNA-binding NarL/FixJ family response regulator
LGSVCATEHTTVLIAGDHPIYRSGLRILLDGVDSLEVVGEAGTGADAVARTRELRPQVVVMDVVLSGAALAEVISPLTGRCPGTAVLIVSPIDDRETFLSAMRAGARGYLLNGAHWQDLVLAVEIVRSGGLVFDSCSSDWVMDRLGQTTGVEKRLPEFGGRGGEAIEIAPRGRPGTVTEFVPPARTGYPRRGNDTGGSDWSWSPA